MIVSMLAAVALMTQAAPAATPDPAQAEPAPAVATKKKLTKEGMQCHNEQVMGSKLPKRVCYTAEQAAERKARDRELTEYIQRSMRLPCDACN